MTTPDVAAKAAPMLAIVGAGAKAVAVAAKAAELRDMGVEVPDVVAVERTGVAANWQADGGSAPAPRRTSASRTARR
jgi:mycobactin lysine-N-oxygenase